MAQALELNFTNTQLRRLSDNGLSSTYLYTCPSGEKQLLHSYPKTETGLAQKERTVSYYRLGESITTRRSVTQETLFSQSHQRNLRYSSKSVTERSPDDERNTKRSWLSRLNLQSNYERQLGELKWLDDVTIDANSVRTRSTTPEKTKFTQSVNHTVRTSNQLVRELKSRELDFPDYYSLAHAPKIVGIPAYICELEDADNCYLVREYVEGITLDATLRSQYLPMSYRYDLIIEVVSIVERLHRLGLSHLLINPEHIIIASSNQRPYLIGGSQIRLVGDKLDGELVTNAPGFVLPEQSYSDLVLAQTDNYSLASVIACIALGISMDELPQLLKKDGKFKRGALSTLLFSCPSLRSSLLTFQNSNQLLVEVLNVVF